MAIRIDYDMLTSTTPITKENKNIDFYICKSYFKKNMDKKAFIISKETDSVIMKVQRTLSESGYNVAISKNTNIDLEVKKNGRITFIDCRNNFSLLEEVKKYRRLNPLLVAIVKEDFNDRKKLVNYKIYDYITPNFSDVELVNKTNLYLLYSAASSLDLFIEGNESDPLTLRYDKEDRLVKSACNYIIDHLADPIPIRILCRSIGTNRNTLAKAFRNKMDISVYCWIRKKRIEKASLLLKNTRMSVQNICFEAGYENAANFSTAFKSISGISPNAYRKLHQKQAS